MVVEFLVKKIVILNSGRNHLYVKVAYLLNWKIRSTLILSFIVLQFNYLIFNLDSHIKSRVGQEMNLSHIE